MIQLSTAAKIPFDEETRAVIARRLRLWNFLLPICLGSTVLVVAGFVAFATKLEMDREMVIVLGIVAIALDALAMWLVMRTVTAPFKRDLDAGYYLRARARPRFTDSGDGAITFDLDGRSLSVSASVAARVSEGWKVVDFTEHSHVVLAIRDEDGAVLYQAGKPIVGT